MSTSTKQQELHVMNVEEPTLKKESLLERPLNSSQEQASRLTSQSPSLPAKNADTSTQSFFQKSSKNLTRFWSGLQSEIYD
jgi:hypothetical protein